MKIIRIIAILGICIGLCSYAIAQNPIPVPTPKKETPGNTKTPSPKKSKKVPPKDSKQNWVTLRTEYMPLDYEFKEMATGKIFYASGDEYMKMPIEQKNTLRNQGVVFIGNGEEFVLSGKHYSDITWDEAMARNFKNSSANSAFEENAPHKLPTINQAEVIFKNIDEWKAKKMMGPLMWLSLWVSKEDDSQKAFAISNSGIMPYDKTGKRDARYVVKVLKSSPEGVKWRTQPKHLDVELLKDGKYYYVSSNEWKDAPRYRKQDFLATGIVLKNNDKFFIFSPYSKVKCSWKSATNKFGNQLPSKQEADLILDNMEAMKDVAKTMISDVINLYLSNGINRLNACWTRDLVNPTSKDKDKEAWVYNLFTKNKNEKQKLVENSKRNAELPVFTIHPIGNMTTGKTASAGYNYKPK